MTGTASKVYGSSGWVDKHGDVWTLGADGLLHTLETRPFPPEYVEKKWGPLRPATSTTAPTNASPTATATAP